MTVPLDDALALTVGEVMIQAPKTLPADAPDSAPARAYAETEPVIATAEMPMTDAINLLEARGEPRLIVLADDGETLAGLLCANETGTGFCVRP